MEGALIPPYSMITFFPLAVDIALFNNSIIVIIIAIVIIIMIIIIMMTIIVDRMVDAPGFVQYRYRCDRSTTRCFMHWYPQL